MVAEVRYHVGIARKVTGITRELWMAREVSCHSSETVSILLHLPNDKGTAYGVPDRVGGWLEWRQVAQTWKHTNDKHYDEWAIAARPPARPPARSPARELYSFFGGSGGLCVKWR